jgi:glycosyltransferase involved in cell wall biosynthesis
MRKNILVFGHSAGILFTNIYQKYIQLFPRDQYHITMVFLTAKEDEQLKQQVTADDIIFLGADKKNKRGLKIKVMLQMLALCRKRRFAMVICHRYKPTFIMLFVAKLIKIPVVIAIMHAMATMTSWRRQLTITLLKNPRLMFAGVSNAVRDDLRQHLWSIPKERIITLYNCIDITNTEKNILTKQQARTILKLDQGDFIFGNIARLTHDKDHVTLIHAFAKAKALCKHSKLVIIGDGKLANKLKRLIKQLNLEQDIIMTGHINNAYQYLQAFDCFVLSSIKEAFGMVLLEAMVARRPIIATNVFGIPEVIGENSLLFDAKDGNNLVKMMQQIYNMPTEQRCQQGEYYYRRVNEQFSQDAFNKNFWHQLSFYME